MKLVFATHNLNKLKEIQELVPPGIEILSLTDINCTEDIEETGITLEENAKIKVDYIKDHYGYDCFADDSGLEIDALDGAPGVYSARYAGVEKSNEKNIEKVWAKLAEKKDTASQFRTIIAAHIDGKRLQCEGKVRGTIIFEKRGEGGFGYDPIFIPEGYSKTFAELGKEVKNEISHRAKAFSLFLSSL
ncbi:non-canonical purine NTP diphosphatase [Flavobacteriaceae bacterium]|nr:non-canonical purine NTP diphosphatase [Flavobacteriaceae bacterium]|tara:strand:- start:3360 stop:3926 length:567 start_codon:yes stop_codon:yes gene_type:complete